MLRMRFILSFFCFMFIMSALTLCASAYLGLPTVGGWMCGDLKTVKLDTVSGNQGVWLERSYRTESGTPFKAILMSGKGLAAHTIHSSDEGLTKSDGLMGAGSTYRTLCIDGRPAVLERHPELGVSLSVFIDGAVLTIESDRWGLSDGEAVSAAEEIIKADPIR